MWKESSHVAVAVRGCSRRVLGVMQALEDATGRAVDVIDLDRHPSAESFILSAVKV